MPRYFFHFVHQKGCVRDGEGLELPDLKRAHAHATLLIKQVTVSDALYDWRGWSIKITDANGWSPLIVLFPTGGAYRTAVRQVEDAIAFLVIPRAVTAKHRRS